MSIWYLIKGDLPCHCHDYGRTWGLCPHALHFVGEIHCSSGSATYDHHTSLAWQYRPLSVWLSLEQSSIAVHSLPVEPAPLPPACMTKKHTTTYKCILLVGSKILRLASIISLSYFLTLYILIRTHTHTCSHEWILSLVSRTAGHAPLAHETRTQYTANTENYHNTEVIEYGVSDFSREQVHLAIGVGNWHFPFLMENYSLSSQTILQPPEKWERTLSHFFGGWEMGWLDRLGELGTIFILKVHNFLASLHFFHT